MTQQEKQDIERINWDESYLGLLPDERRTKAVWEAAFKNVPAVIYDMPKEYITKEIAERAVRSDGILLKYIPDNFKTPELCESAVEQDYKLLSYVPEEMRTKEMCKSVLNQIDYTDESMWNVVPHIHHPDICLKLLKMCPERDLIDVYLCMNDKAIDKNIVDFMLRDSMDNFMYIPTTFRNKELCEKAVLYDGFNLHQVPEEYKDNELILKAIDKDPNNILYVPEKLQTSELLHKVVEKDGMALMNIDLEKRDYSLCRKALDNTDNPAIISHIPYPDLCLEAYGKLKTNINLIDLLRNNEKGWSYELAEKFIEKNPLSIQQIPFDYRDRALCEKAVDKHPLALSLIPDNYKSITMCITAVGRDPYAISGILPEFKNENIYKYLVDMNPHNIKGIPMESRSKDICEIVLEKTFKRDGNLELIPYITHPEVFLKAFKDIKEDNQQKLLLVGLNKNTFSKDLSNYLLEKDASKLCYVPPQIVTDKLYEKMLEKRADAFGMIHPSRITPEMCLIAVKNDSSMKSLVPPHISSGENIYTFNKLIESKYNLKLNVSDVKDLFKGNALRIDRINTDKGVLSNQVIKFSEPFGPKIDMKPVTTHRNFYETTPKSGHNVKKSGGLKLR